MAGGGDYEFYRRNFQRVQFDFDLVATDSLTVNGVGVIAAPAAGYQICVQRIDVNIRTDAAQSLTFQDNAGTALKLAKIPASPGVDTKWAFDFGPRGVPLTAAKRLDIVASAAGLAASISIMGYIRQSSAIAAQSAPSVGIGPTGLN